MKYLILLCLLLIAPRLEATGFLHARGQDIVDESGQKIRLRGVGLGNWMLPEGYMWRFGSEGDRPRRIEKIVSDLIGLEEAAKFWTEYRRQYITEADLQRIADLGFNSVRPSLNARLFLTEGPHPSPVEEGFSLLDNLIRWGKNHGVYVIIDMHAAPGGQTGQNIDDSANDRPELFTDSGNQDRLVALWTKMASRYKDEPTVAAYDLLNEPLPERTGAAKRYKSQLEPLYKRITKAIRAVDARHIITVEGANWANDWSVFSHPFDANLVYQFHYYAWDRPDKLKGIGEYLEYRDKFNAPVWVGETGEKDDAIYWATTQYFEASNIGWSFWPWKKISARNAPYSIKAPEHWRELAAYSSGSDKPSPEIARAALAQLLQNIRLENCEFHPDVVNALFHRVPGRVEAENYGDDGANKSYFVHTAVNSTHYRTAEPVPIALVENGGDRYSSAQAIQLQEGEWTAYDINSLEPKNLSATLQAKVESLPASVEISCDNQQQEVTVSNTKWSQVDLKPVQFAKGMNHLKLRVKQGVIQFDWVEFK
ncbi:MAG TPA: cellulase family glycosylhydrolase [Candidatus Saccharimonadales bacterium]|nr:cellulase family glycosylhydrolase [Candidatus Saccharimonadales bacterium]